MVQSPSTGRVPEAIAAYERALRLAPNDAGTLNDLGTALLAENKPDEALKHLERAASLSPGASSCVVIRARSDFSPSICALSSMRSTKRMISA